MFHNWINSFKQSTETADSKRDVDLHKVSACLLLEVARADHQIDDTERSAIISAIGRATDLSATELEELVTEAEQQADAAISLHEHIRLVNDEFSREQKIKLIEQLWRVAYADSELDRYEEAFIRKIADLIYLKHRDFMQAKLRVTEP